MLNESRLKRWKFFFINFDSDLKGGGGERYFQRLVPSSELTSFDLYRVRATKPNDFQGTQEMGGPRFIESLTHRLIRHDAMTI